MTDDDAHAFRTLFRAERDALLPQLDDLNPDDWHRPSPCEGWDVLDVLVHMQLGAMVHSGLVENGLAGRDVPPWTVPEGADARTWFQQVHRDAHIEGPSRNLALLHERLARYDAVLAGISDDDLERPAWFYGLPATLRKVISAFVNDLIVHATDIRRPLGINPSFSTEGGHFAGQAVFPYLPMFVSAERLAGAAGTIRHVVDGETTLVSVGPMGAGVAPQPAAPADATLTTDGGTLALLAWRALPIADAEEGGRLQIEGDRGFVERYLGALRTP
jgi:uncharacterized protein (TIGR03083 family)